jgi:hypothetical protein
MTIKIILQLAIDTEFFHSAFVSLVRCKAKGAARAVCASLRNVRIWPLSA